MGELSRRRLSAVIIILVLIRGLELGATLVWVRWMDREQYISQRRLQAALLTTYHSPDRGLPTTLSFADLGQHLVFARPSKCQPLTAPTSLLHITAAGIWSGTVEGQSVSIVAVSFSSAADARRELLSKRVALARCPMIRVKFAPYDQVAKLHRVSDHSPISPLRWNRVRFRISREDSYEFYVRQFGNTLTWTYGYADKSSTVRAQAVDSFVARLRELGGR